MATKPSIITYPSATETDPNAQGWMQGSPPPADKLVRFADGSHLQFPQLRWSLSHFDELMPTKNISRGLTQVAPLLRSDRDDLDAVRFTPMGATSSMTWADALGANYTDGVVVLHKGRIVYERYLGALRAHMPHIAFSITKSFTGLLAASMVQAAATATPAILFIPR